MRFYVEIVVWNRGHFRFDLMCRGYISASQTILFHTRILFLIFMLWKKKYKNEKKKIIFFLIWSYQKGTLGLLNHRQNKYIKQQNHHSIFFTPTKGRVVNGSFNDLDRMDSISFFNRIEEKEKVNSIVEPYAQKMPVRLYNSIFFFLYFFYPLL